MSGISGGTWGGERYDPYPTTTTRESGSSSVLTQSQRRVSVKEVLTLNELSDDGEGGFVAGMGTINYAGKSLNVKVVTRGSSAVSYESDHEQGTSFSELNSDTEPGGEAGGSGGGSNTMRGGAYGSTEIGEDLFAGSSLTATYSVAPVTPLSASMTFTPPQVVLDLAPYTKDTIVPNSIQFTWMNTVYVDFEGTIYRDRTDNNPGIACGTMDYQSGMAAMFDYVVDGDPTNFVLNSLYTRKIGWNTASIFMRTAVSPIKPSSFVMSVVGMDGTQVVATSGSDGSFSGSHVQGRIEYATGVVELQFGDWVDVDDLTAEELTEWWFDEDEVNDDNEIFRPWPVDPSTFRYNAVAYFYLPLDADILGLDPVRLPQDGRVPIFRPGGFAVIGNTKVTSPATVSNAQTVNLGRVRLSRVVVRGDDGVAINTGYTANLEAGTVTFSDVTGYDQPVTIEHRIEDLVQVSDVQITGKLGFTRAVTHNYDADESYVSSALITGDMRSRVSTLFDQATWDGVTFSDILVGSPATGTYNDTAYPVEVSNIGAVTERWSLRFTSNTAFQIIGEHVGIIGTGTINTDTAPVNPATSQPYFTLREDGWGTGWIPGNILRINTVGAIKPFWCVRTVQQGPEAGDDYSFSLLTRGGVDAP